jgi:hypothetical protein
VKAAGVYRNSGASGTTRRAGCTRIPTRTVMSCDRPGVVLHSKMDIRGGPPDMPEVVYTAPPPKGGTPPCAALVLLLEPPRSS